MSFSPSVGPILLGAVFGGDRSVLTPNLWLGLRGAGGDVGQPRVPVDLDDFTATGLGVESASVWDLGVAVDDFTATSVVFWDAPTDGSVFVEVPLAAPVSVLEGEGVVLGAGGVNFDYAAPEYITYRWTGGVNASASEEVAPDGVTVLRTNEITQPRPVGSAYWFFASGSSAVSAGVVAISNTAGVGTAIFTGPRSSVGSRLPLVEGCGGISLRVSTPEGYPALTLRAMITFVDESNTVVGTPTLIGIPVDEHVRAYEFFPTAPEGADTYTVAIKSNDAAASGRRINIELSSAPGTYFDGDSEARRV